MALNWEVFTRQSTLDIQIHWATATLAFLIGLVLFARAKGTRTHIALGSAYCGLMLVTSLAAFFIRHEPVSGWAWLSPKGMSPIHLFIPLTLFGILGGLHGILVRRSRHAHKWPMISSFAGALVIAGAFTFIPGRRVHRFFFGGETDLAALCCLAP